MNFEMVMLELSGPTTVVTGRSNEWNTWYCEEESNDDSLLAIQLEMYQNLNWTFLLFSQCSHIDLETKEEEEEEEKINHHR